MPRIFVRMARSDVRDTIVSFVKSCAGTATEHAESASVIHTAMGLAVLSDIKTDFIRKARGGTGEDGVKWEPLSKEYVAYQRRFGKGEKAGLKKAAGLGSGHRHRGLLTAQQNKRWKAIFASNYKRLAVSLGDEGAKARAAQIAWAILKKEGAKTMLEVFGNRQVEILRDTGVLFNSLSPAYWPGEGPYQPPEDQLFQLAKNGVAVGTNVPYAAVHQNGSEKKKIPARPFLPVNQLPDVWRLNMISAGVSAAYGQLIRIFEAKQ
jgi:hypothetical protein